MGQAQRKAAFVNSAADYKISDGDDFKVTINAKDFPDAGEHGQFRVYKVYGDITKPERLRKAIENLLIERGIERREIQINL